MVQNINIRRTEAALKTKGTPSLYYISIYCLVLFCLPPVALFNLVSLGEISAQVTSWCVSSGTKWFSVHERNWLGLGEGEKVFEDFAALHLQTAAWGDMMNVISSFVWHCEFWSATHSLWLSDIGFRLHGKLAEMSVLKRQWERPLRLSIF